MWLTLLLVPIAAIAGFVAKEKFFPSTPTGSDPPKAGGTVDGHGTGVLPTGKTVDGHGTGVIPEPNPLAAAAAAQQIAQEQAQKAAAAQAAAAVAGQNTPASAANAAAIAAEAVRQQLITAMNTPEGDRTPEQLALLAGIANLPTLGT